MLKSRRIYVALLASLLLIVPSLARAEGPAAVTVTAIAGGGSQFQTLIPLIQVSTTTTPVVKDGNPQDSCSGTSAAGALQLATETTHGSWGGTWSKGLGYSVETIDGVSYLFEPSSPANYYWTFWLNDKPATTGICEAQLNPGDRILFFRECFSEETGKCPTPSNVLALEAPADAEVGKPVAVTVLEYPNAGGQPKPALNATVNGAAPTNEKGQTTVTFTTTGTVALHASGNSETQPEVPAEALICVHNGNDGNCGTTAPSSPTTSTTTTNTPNTAPAGTDTAKVKGLNSGHVYSRRKAPRLLQGSVVAPTGVLLRSVQISLKRKYHGHCFGFNGNSRRFVAINCKRAAPFFSVGNSTSFSYLLPRRLPRGFYTYDIQAVNGSGETTKLENGVNHITFSVR